MTNFSNKLSPFIGLIHQEPGTENFDVDLMKDHYLKDWILGAYLKGHSLSSGYFSESDKKIKSVTVCFNFGTDSIIQSFPDISVSDPASGRFIYYASKGSSEIKSKELPEYISLSSSGFELGSDDLPLLHVGVYHKLGTTNDVFYKWIGPKYNQSPTFKKAQVTDVLQTQNLGIKTDSPTTDLHIAGGDVGAIQVDSSRISLLNLNRPDLSKYYNIELGRNSNGDLTFYNQLGGSKMTLSEYGNLGIGTTTPNFPLHIKSSSSCNIAIDGGSNNDAGLYFNHSGSTVAWIRSIDANNNVLFGSVKDGTDIIFRTGNNVRSPDIMTLKDDQSINILNLFHFNKNHKSFSVGNYSTTYNTDSSIFTHSDSGVRGLSINSSGSPTLSFGQNYKERYILFSNLDHEFCLSRADEYFQVFKLSEDTSTFYSHEFKVGDGYKLVFNKDDIKLSIGGNTNLYDRDAQVYISDGTNNRVSLAVEAANGKGPEVSFGLNKKEKFYLGLTGDNTFFVNKRLSNGDSSTVFKVDPYSASDETPYLNLHKPIRLPNWSTSSIKNSAVGAGSLFYDADTDVISYKDRNLKTKHVRIPKVGHIEINLFIDYSEFIPGNTTPYKLDNQALGYVFAAGYKVTSSNHYSSLIAGDDYDIIIDHDDYLELLDKMVGPSTEVSSSLLGGVPMYIKIPDLRGSFFRSIDAGRGIDPDLSRSIQSIQDDALQGHDHYLGSQDSSTGHSNSYNMEFIRNYNSGSGPKANASPPRALDSYGTPRLANETRPTNMAVVPIIKIY